MILNPELRCMYIFGLSCSTLCIASSAPAVSNIGAVYVELEDVENPALFLESDNATSCYGAVGTPNTPSARVVNLVAPKQ